MLCPPWLTRDMLQLVPETSLVGDCEHETPLNYGHTIYYTNIKKLLQLTAVGLLVE